VTRPAAGGTGRWARLWPADAADGALVALALLGGLLWLTGRLAGDVPVLGPAFLAAPVGALVVLHRSTPLLVFLALALYLTRRGRTIGPRRRWVWAGFGLVLPLTLLVGQPVVVRGAGDVTWLVVPWNLAALVLMGVGVWRQLRAG